MGAPPKEHQFKPGQSGNPSGRPKAVAEFRAWLDETDIERKMSRREAVRARLYEIACTAKAQDAARAIELIAAYDMGKPVQSVETEDGRKLAAVVFLPAETP